ncbi:unnamed protein product, partial [Prorocentrum cordatum]
VRRWRCDHCDASFSVGPGDVMGACPSALRCADPRRLSCGFHVTRPFLMMVLQKFMEVLNLRTDRRFLGIVSFGSACASDIHVYSGPAVKGDVDGDGAPRWSHRARPITNVRAWTCIGALEKPAALAPASHSTDVYEGRRTLLQSLYQSKFPSLRFRVHPKAPRECSAAAAQGPGAIVTGEPMHWFFEVRRLATCIANDAEIFLAEAALDPVNMERVWTFLAQPCCGKAATWKRLSGSQTPRGALARIARLCGAQLDSSASRSNYRAAKASKAELTRVQRWYRPGRRQRRWRTGIARDRRQAEVVKGARSVIAKKVRDHIRRMRRRVKVEGPMNWREVALAARQAGIPVQSGTLPVERPWSCLEDRMPSAARGASLRWFRVLSMVMFLRYNYAHFNKDNLPTMADRDHLLGQRLATIAMLARAANEPDQGLSHLPPFFAPFGSR